MPESEAKLDVVDAIVLGCGVSGLTAARELADQGASVLVLDDYDTPGGNHISRQIGPYTFDIGAIFFWSTSPMLTIFPEATKAWQPIDLSIGRITPNRAVHRYPLDVRAEILSLPIARKLQIAADIAYHRLFHRKRDSVRDFALQRMGRRLFDETGLELYFERFCGRPADEIVYAFAEWRMRWIRKQTSLSTALGKGVTAIRRKFGASEPPLQCFARPREGFSYMYLPIVEELTKSGVQFVFNAGMSEIRSLDGGFEVSALKGNFRSTRLLNTIPLAVVARLTGLTGYQAPESCSMITLFCRFKGNRRFPFTVLYNFNRIGAWKRLTMHSDYYGQEEGWEYFSAEFTMTGGKKSPDALFDDFRRSTVELGVFDGSLELLGSLETDFAYPVFDADSIRNRDSLMASLGEMGIESFGRQGAFDYIASSNLAIELAKQALESRKY